MHTLFTTVQRSLPAFFRSLPADDVRDCCSPSDYNHGKDYFEAKAVSQLVFNNEKPRLKAIVSGNNDYSVTITLDNGRITGSCTCPDYDVCKHVVATMLYASDEKSEFKIEPDDNKDAGNVFYRYLQSLSTDELVALVDKFASEQFRTEVKNRFANASKALKTFHKVEQTIRKLFEDNDLMYSPNDFSDALDDELEKLSGFEKTLDKEIEELLFYIIKRVDNALEDGYLYDDYGDENYDASMRFEEFLVRYVSSLSSNRKTAILAKLDALLEAQMAYAAFDCLRDVAKSVFAEADLPFLKKVLLSDYRNISRKLAGYYYDHVTGFLSYDEKTDVLSVLMESNDVRAIELAALHDAHGNLSKATETMHAWIEKNKDSYCCREDAWSFYLDLLMKGNHDLSDIAADAIINRSTARMLSKIISLTDSDPARYELLLENRDAGELLRYLQQKELPEALALIKRKKDKIYDNHILEFFKTHKLLFPEEAATCFGEVIEKNLQDTGNRYYEAIADAVRHLEKVNRAKADKYVSYIRTNYKRRRNLIDLLNQAY